MPAAVTATDLGQNLLGGLEREVVQEQHDLVPVTGQVFRRPNDQRRRKKLHLLDRHMAVHPECARQRREIVGPRLARREQGQWHVGDAVLRVGRDLAVPVNDRAHVEIVGQVNPEPLAGIKNQPLATRPGKAEDGGRATVDVKRASRGGQGERRRRLRHRSARKVSGGKRRRTCGEKAASRKVVHGRLLGTSGPVPNTGRMPRASAQAGSEETEFGRTLVQSRLPAGLDCPARQVVASKPVVA